MATNRELTWSPQKSAGMDLVQDCGFQPQRTAEPSGGGRFLPALGVNSLIVALLAPLAALASESVQKILLAVVVLDIPIEFGTYLFYRPIEASLGALKGLSISATTIALAGLYASWFLRAVGKRTYGVRSTLYVNLALVCYLSITILSALVAQDKALSFFDIYLLFEACLIYFYVANNIRTRRDVLFVVTLLLGGCLLESVIIIIMRFTVSASTTWNFPIHLIAEGLADGDRMRIGGTIGVPNVAGAYLSVMLSLAFAMLLTDLGKLHKRLAVAVIGFGGVALIFTFSRGAWMALAVAFMILGFVAWRERGISMKKLAATLAVMALIYLPFHAVISARMFGDDKGSAQSRIPLNKLAFRMIIDNPVLGVGANNFTVVMEQYATSEFRREWLWAVHNRYLLVLAETGPAGLLAYLAFLLGTLRKGFQTWKFRDALLSPLAFGFAAGIAGHLLHQNVDLFRDRPIRQLLWLTAGLLVAMSRICAASQKDNLPEALPKMWPAEALQ